MTKRTTKSKSLPWFRIFSKAFITETLGLNATEIGIYIRLLAAMNEADEPITGSALSILPRLLGVRQKTFGEAVEKLIERNLIDRLPEGLWAPLMDEERAFRDRNSDKARSNSVKRWRKTQQNQRGSDANHTHTHREAPKGASRYEDSSERERLDIKGASSAYAGSPHTAEGREDFTAGDPSFDGREGGDGLEGRPPSGGKEEISSLDRINLELAEALEAAASGVEIDPFAYVAAEEPPEYLNAIPPCDADELAGFVPEAAGSVELDNRDDGGEDVDFSVCTWIEPEAAGSANPMSEVPEASHKPPRWPDEIDPDAEYDEGREPIRDSADGGWLLGWPDNETEEFEVDEDGRERPIRVAR